MVSCLDSRALPKAPWTIEFALKSGNTLIPPAKAVIEVALAGPRGVPGAVVFVWMRRWRSGDAW
jgi:hypothetical protein